MDETKLKPLSKKHQAFVDQYFMCGMNATEAYMRVYKPKSGRGTARANAADLLAITNIKAEVEARLEELHMSSDQALKLQTDIANGDMGDFYDDNLILDFKGAREKGLTKLVRKIKQKTTTFIAKGKDEQDREVHEIELELYPADIAQERILKVHDKIKPDSSFEIVVKYANANGKPA